jgi:long-chain acyl-CoA synthetase
MRSEDRLLAAWEETLARKRDAPAIFNVDATVARTFLQIDDEARQFECKLNKFIAGNAIAVQIGNHESWLAVFIACLRRGLVVLPLDRSISEVQRNAAFKTCGVVAAAMTGGREIKLPPAVTPAATIHCENPPSLLKLTSGTTGEPRMIRFRSEQLLADGNQICETMGIEDVDLNFGAIPISHSYGFSNLLTPLIARGVPLVLSRDRTPRALLLDLARTNATVFAGTPAFYQALAEIDDPPKLPRLRLCISAGAPLPIAVARKFQERFKLPIHSFYGASECGGICYDREAVNEIEGFVGQPMKDVDVVMIDGNAEVSHVRVHSAATGDGYFPQENREKLGNGVFTPDDLLTKTAQGFRLVGRVSDVINVAGKKVHPAEVEAQLRRFAGVREAVAFGRQSTLRNEEVAACVVAEHKVTEGALLEFCRQHLSSWQVPRRIFIVNELPVNERGKISRRELARRFAA